MVLSTLLKNNSFTVASKHLCNCREFDQKQQCMASLLYLLTLMLVPKMFLSVLSNVIVFPFSSIDKNFVNCEDCKVNQINDDGGITISDLF